MKKFLTLILALTLITVPAITTLTSCVETDSKDEDEDDKKASYADAIEKFETVLNGDITEETLMAVAPEAVWEVELDGRDIKDVVDDLVDEYESMEDYFPDGLELEDMKIVIEVTDEEKLDKDVCEEISESLENNYGEEFTVEKAYRLSAVQKYDIDYDKIEDEEERELFEEGMSDSDSDLEYYAVNIDGEWYLIEESEGDYYFDLI